jgi:hypothetical protein
MAAHMKRMSVGPQDADGEQVNHHARGRAVEVTDVGALLNI